MAIFTSNEEPKYAILQISSTKPVRIWQDFKTRRIWPRLAYYRAYLSTRIVSPATLFILNSRQASKHGDQFVRLGSHKDERGVNPTWDMARFDLLDSDGAPHIHHIHRSLQPRRPNFSTPTEFFFRIISVGLPSNWSGLPRCCLFVIDDRRGSPGLISALPTLVFVVPD
ncbi:hypothetical protein AG1IA_08489 [Rhizoctonia solani AG-1 IA]|uniref:Uncharacterized protein n=1 Tax=Thanatephorus cucumeris (strain AG1-IA) TaxID=983506 RepID=L8WH12_THACA|nr:hypothetical protein AG1IA_08489 [Rhizoctonia solani AG-1 IA]